MADTILEDAPTQEEAPETEAAAPNPGEFTLTIIDETKPTVDGRYFVPDVVTWRDPPIPLMFTVTNGNGHKGGTVGGAITKIWREDGKVMGRGHFESGDNGQELRRLISEGVLTGVSADVGGALVELEAEGDKQMQKITEGRILGVTALPLQAYDDTRIAVTAAAIPAAPPVDWFADPKLASPTPITVTADGRVYGHAATWGTCHVGHKNQCLTPPRSRTNYAHFCVGEVECEDGSRIPTGPITLGTGHAGLSLDAFSTRDHYDNTGTAVADVTAGEDAFGIWVAGAMRPTVSDDRIREFRASALSGDWRSIGGSLEMVGLLAVNVPGFPVPRTRASFADEKPLALVAAGVVEDDEEDCGCDEAPAATAPEADVEEITAGGEFKVDIGLVDIGLDAQLEVLEAAVEDLAAKILAEGEFRNPYAGQQPRDSHGRWRNGGGLGSLVRKYSKNSADRGKAIATGRGSSSRVGEALAKRKIARDLAKKHGDSFRRTRADEVAGHVVKHAGDNAGGKKTEAVARGYQGKLAELKKRQGDRNRTIANMKRKYKKR